MTRMFPTAPALGHVGPNRLPSLTLPVQPLEASCAALLTEDLEVAQRVKWQDVHNVLADGSGKIIKEEKRRERHKSSQFPTRWDPREGRTAVQCAICVSFLVGLAFFQNKKGERRGEEGELNEPALPGPLPVLSLGPGVSVPATGRDATPQTGWLKQSQADLLTLLKAEGLDVSRCGFFRGLSLACQQLSWCVLTGSPSVHAPTCLSSRRTPVRPHRGPSEEHGFNFIPSVKAHLQRQSRWKFEDGDTEAAKSWLSWAEGNGGVTQWGRGPSQAAAAVPTLPTTLGGAELPAPGHLLRIQNGGIGTGLQESSSFLTWAHPGTCSPPVLSDGSPADLVQ
uniref:Uncharacterized protein LOC112831632 n=1 Tax=Callorhinus ursinus TaxID=34884 RepID=A0A3Q7PVD3_CALUR|nr:uncharacterized protein LOC112831632 [Callorhinus ursinus]